MNFKQVMILMVFGSNHLNATQIYEEGGEETFGVGSVNVTEENLTIYYKGLKVAEPAGLCNQNQCLTKCCPFGAKYNVTSKMCVNTAQIFDPQMYDNYLRLQNANANDLFYFNIGIIKCKERIRTLMSDYALKIKKEFHLRMDGKLYIESPHSVPPWMLVRPENYCIDNFVHERDSKNITKVDALVCFVHEKDLHDYVLTAICMLVSCAFILLTVGVYTWLPKLHNVHGRVLIAYLSCLFVGFLNTATMQLLIHYEKQTKQACLSMTFIIYFSLLSAFFWLNVMCYDIWRVFSGKRQIRPQMPMVWAQICSYAKYAFGIPSILTILLISLEYSDLPLHPWLPMIRLQGCFLSGNTRLLYLYGPILILCVANMVLFILTALKIAMTKKETSVLSSRESTRHDQQNNKQTLFLYVKLFILMGVSWIFEVVSTLYPSENWIYTDVYNVLIGLIIFVCKGHIFNLLKERYKEMKHHPASQNNTILSRTTATKNETTFNTINNQ